MPAITVERTVYHANSETTLVRDVSEDMLLLEPDQSPLLVLTNKNKRKTPSDTPKFEWFEDVEVAVWDTVAATADYGTTDTTILVTDHTLYAVGDILLLPKAATSAALEEMVRVTEVGTNSVTVTRGAGGTTADTIGSTQAIRIMGGGLVEGGDVPSVRTTQKTPKASYCGIHRTSVDVSRTMEATKAYGAPQGERKFQLMKALARHKQEIEAAMLWSRGSETLAAAGTVWTTQGVKQTIVDNVTDASGTFTLTKFNDFCETAFRYGSSEKLLMSAPKIISAMNYFSQNKLLTSVGDKVFGVAITRFLANGFGEFLLANNFRMGDGIAGKAGFQDEAYAIDLPSVKYRYLAGNGNSQDTKLYENVKQDGKARRVDEYYTQAGSEVRFSKKHARLHNATSYS
jgi:hypothetical protein